ncbi:DEAD/DEAH box helicase [Streptomonospora halophila]|uniref:DEAD/DEAH box helicase n=1 Tax=Streptomonospora halophila TaxID=427369 RepID=A0ABP9GB35_9ACTN
MTTTVHDIIDSLRQQATSNHERGSLFESLMVAYLRTDPVYANHFTDVWRWADWPDAPSKNDDGIDLVATTVDGGHCAIQCKFYEPEHTLQKADIDSFFTASGRSPFTERMIISTTDKWGHNAEKALQQQQIPVSRLGLDDLADSPIAWEQVWPRIGVDVTLPLNPPQELREHQREALDAVADGFAAHDRGKLIMACGTGKTFTSLKIAEHLAADKPAGEPARVLFLVPSISLLSQSLREWNAQCAMNLRSFAVCSDAKVSKQRVDNDLQDMSTHDLALPATTDAATLLAQMRASHGEHRSGLEVVFSTYQSIQAVHEAQEAGVGAFDLVICDEAHRTTGVTLAGENESHFVKVHDNSYLRAHRRLYMTATPKLFDDNVKTTAKENDAELCSMDDETLFGPEFYRLGFGEAVERELLTDYRVLILNVDETFLSTTLQSQLSEDGELNIDDAARIVGCWNGLAKRGGNTPDGQGFKPGEAPMRRAVAFARNIADSKHITDQFENVVDGVNEENDKAGEPRLRCEVQHIDGSANALTRNRRLDWLKAEPDEGTCRILSNARCLSEGVDVPALDAVLFLHPRNSVVDVVQSVGRVMRTADDKEYGYIILPVGIPTTEKPEKALNDNKRFKVVWQVLQALRAHDDRMNATVNQIDLNRNKPDNILVNTVTGEDFDGTRDGLAGEGDDNSQTGGDDGTETTKAVQDMIAYPWGELREAIYARIVTKVGERHYWEDWADDIADIAQRHVTRINTAIADPDSDKAHAFEQFLAELRANLNPGITHANAVDMLAQHMITKPVFDALFADYAFSTQNPVSLAMEQMLTQLEDEAIGNEADTLEGFYASVRKRAEGIDNHEGRQRVITELYERFFKKALPKTAESFGIVYTPVEVVDFILRATNQALYKHFNETLSGEGVHIIDPFTGTGTFIVRLLQSGLIKQDDLLRKYTQELHANEIVLLAYYIAAVNIEAAFHQRHQGDYVPFEGIVLTDTFQLAEDTGALEAVMFGDNNERVRQQQSQDIRVVIGNPPYSSGQTSQNDNNQNQKYSHLDGRITDTYAAKSSAQNKNSLYDSYIRAIRWASDRVTDNGVICYVSNGGYIDGNTADGLRKSLADEFSTIYCFNLRGNQRTAGEQSRMEGGKVFGSGSRSTVAILLLVKDSTSVGSCRLFYEDIGDYLTREQKLSIVAESNLDTINWQEIRPTHEGDWVNQRDPQFSAHLPVAGEEIEKGIFVSHSRGLETTRDAWVYNYSESHVLKNMERMIDFYNMQIDAFHNYCESNGISRPSAQDVGGFLDNDPTKISWSSSLMSKAQRGIRGYFSGENVRKGVYRVFSSQNVYFDGMFNHRTGVLSKYFPFSGVDNFGFYYVGAGSAVPFSVLMIDGLPDLHVTGAGSGGQFFPRYTYRETGSGNDLFSAAEESGFERLDNITDAGLASFQKSYGPLVSKDDVFYYVYGLLHSPDYRTRFAADLRRSLPRIPMVADFNSFADAGRALAKLHVGYESVTPYPLEEKVTYSTPVPRDELYRVEKMKFKSKEDRSTIVYNNRVTVSGIPEEAHRYQLGARSAIEWIIDRYQVKTDKASGIVNDPNDWSDDPRYILDLLGRIVTVSLETMKIVDDLPPLEILDQQ